MSERKEHEEKAQDPRHRRTMRFLVSLAAETTFPELTLRGGHAVGEGYWFDLDKTVTAEQVGELQAAVKALVEKKLPIVSCSKPWTETLAYLEKNRQPCAAALIKSRVTRTVTLNECNGQMRLFGCELFGNTGDFTGPFGLNAHEGGFIAVYTETFTPQTALLHSMGDHKAWAKLSGISCFGELNQLEIMPTNKRRQLILEAEFRQEQKLCEIATQIHARGGKVRALCIAGPTSSGKTTFANKLSMYLKNIGFEAKPLTVDHYYLSLPDQPKYKIRQDRSDVNYDHIESMDVALVNEHVSALMKGETIMAPHYNFKTGCREGPGTAFSLPSNGIVVMEGIHALNPEYTKGVPAENVFKVYISPLSALQVDDFNAVKTTNHRLLRRMCRDYLFRGHSVSKTLSMWKRVRVGEHSFIFTNQNNADYVMNSAMEYELCILKTFLEPGLKKVTPSDPNFDMAQELLMTLQYVDCWDDRTVPTTSLLREFIGNGAFDEH